MSANWEKAHYTSFMIWDIDREFQNAYEAYEEWMIKNRKRRSAWECIGGKGQDDALGKALSLGREVQKVMETGRHQFGSKFEQGDSTCHTVLAAQLLRVQHEINVPLLDCVHSYTPLPLPYDDILTIANGVRRSCLNALRDQYARLQSPSPSPQLPPPRFSVKFCPFAMQLRKDYKSTHMNRFQAKKVRPHDRHDDREICPYCNAHISVSAHSRLTDYRRVLFQNHVEHSATSADERATFACSGCYKTFDDSYAFLDHIHQKEIGSSRSCLRKSWTGRWSVNSSHSFNSISSVNTVNSVNSTNSTNSMNRVMMENDPVVVEKCLRNCLKREVTRIKALRTSDIKA